MGMTATELPAVLDVPSIWCPIPKKLHPAAEGADDRLLAWARGFDLVRGQKAVDRFHGAGFGAFCALTYPRAVGADRLDLESEWNAYNWVVDDLLDEGHTAMDYEERERMCRELMAQMPLDMHAPRPSGPLYAAMADLWERAAAPMSVAWRKRFVAHYRDWLTGSLLQPTGREGASSHVPYPAFARRRRIHSGCEMSFDLIESGNLEEVSELVTSCDMYEAVRSAASDAIFWTNDIFSIRKELARGDRDHLVAYLRDTQYSNWEEAISEAVRMVEEATNDFLTACADLRQVRGVFSELDDEEWAKVDRSLDDLGDWIAGSLDWHTWSDRYKKVEITAEGEKPSYIELHLL